ncbi:34820_t:CDS:1, partial [Racocetra persica]
IKQTSEFYNMRDTTLCKITDSCPNLQYLKLESSKLSDISLEKVARLCTNLCCLKLDYNKHITDTSIVLIAENCSYIEYLGLCRSNITDASLKQIAKLYSKLYSLSLIDCQKIIDEGICVIASACLNIQKYILEGCEEITDILVKKIAQFNPNPKYLNFSWCLVSNESICAIARSCPKLEQLYLEGCNITDVSMSALANLRNLWKLDIEECDKISVNAIISLQNKISTLNIIGWYSDSNDESDMDNLSE